MARKIRDLRTDLHRAGFDIDHQTGSHQAWKHPVISGVSVVLAGKDGDDAKPYQENQVRRALQALRETQKKEQS